MTPSGWTPDELARFRRGERELLSRLYYDHVQQVAGLVALGFTFRSGDRTVHFDGFRDPHCQQGVVQEVFRRAFEPRAREQYRGDRPFGAWLRRITINCVVDRLRKQMDCLSIDTVDQAGIALDPSTEQAAGQWTANTPEQAEQHTDRRRLCETLRRFWRTLDTEARAIVELRFIDDQPQRATAQALGLSRGSLRRREERLRSRLAHLLERHGYDDW